MLTGGNRNDVTQLLPLLQAIPPIPGLTAGLVVEVTTHTTLAITTAPLVAATILTVFGIHTMVWGVIVVTLRQRVVPQHLLG